MKFLEESVEKKLKRKSSKLKNKWLLAKKLFAALAVFCWLFFLVNYFFTSTKIVRPSADNPVVSYFEESGSDLKYLYCSLLQGAHKNIYYSSFGLSDKDILRIIKKKKEMGVTVTFHNSKKQKKLRKKTSGLYHRKFLLIDDKELYLGSANCTPPSLTFHGNQILGFYHKELINAIQHGTSYISDDLSLYLLPADKKLALQKLLHKIEHAIKRIDLAMYALTHKKIIAALIAAHARGVTLNIYLDEGMSRGTCKKYLLPLREKNIPLHVRIKGGLHHHKCAMIDDCFVFGSINWTASGFTKNEEVLLFLERPTPTLKKDIALFFQNLHFFSKTS
ncbi:hypothetical protein K0U07_05940 [bacterium]|nr:hypothetical protein [bacterium]